LAIVLALSAPAIAGCGSTLYSIRANSASGKLEQARELGAEQSAPYDYFYAKEHLQKAQSEAAEADYSDAVNLAEACEEHAEKAIRLAQEARSGAAR
jgi:predicted S18 family serine protease